MHLIIYTQTYPSSSSVQQPFIERELPYLAQHFEEITIIPQVFSGEELSLPDNVSTETGFSDFYKKQGVLGIIINALRSKYFYQEILQQPSVLLSVKMLLRLIKFVGDAEITREWAKNWIENKSIDISNSLFYSFWFTQIAMGLGLLKEIYPNIRVIARAHGYDIYEERYSPPYSPCRPKTLKLIDRLFLASADAHIYMKKNYPSFSAKYYTAHLGVEASGFISSLSSDDVFRIVSCSSIIPLKRVELLAKSIALMAQIRPNKKIQWIHFGEGPNREKVQKIIGNFLPSIQGKLYGFTPNIQILEHYKNHPVDIFVNLSTTEGGAPVSIMEAISCGIPVIATNVGGNPEIVSEKNGLLLNADPTLMEIAQAFFKIIDNPEETFQKRKNSIMIWREQYNAHENFENFVQQLAALVGNN